MLINPATNKFKVFLQVFPFSKFERLIDCLVSSRARRNSFLETTRYSIIHFFNNKKLQL